MPTYKKAEQELLDIMADLIATAPEHKPLLDAKVRVDLYTAWPDLDDNGIPTNNALMYRGRKVLGKAKILKLLDRTKELGDAEILLDGPHCEARPLIEVRAIIDHELTHLQVRLKNESVITDDLSRPLLKIRKHDEECGFFRSVAIRNGAASAERIEAQRMMDEAGQAYWPAICGEPKTQPPLGINSMTMEAGSTSVTIGPEDARELREACKNISRIGHIENAK